LQQAHETYEFYHKQIIECEKEIQKAVETCCVKATSPKVEVHRNFSKPEADALIENNGVKKKFLSIKQEELVKADEALHPTHSQPDQNRPQVG